MKKLIFTLITVIVCTFLSNAQHMYVIVGYNMATPLGKTSEFTDNFSLRGINAEQRFFLTDNMLTVGYNFGWQVFHENIPEQTIIFDNGAVYGNQFRYINVFPMQATVHYHLMPESYVRPYFGSGIGATRKLQVTEIGLHSESNNSWHMGISPEAGALFDLWEHFNLITALRYNYAFKNGNYESYSSLSFNFSLVWVY